jgi:GMP synthase (glutamine-hydrolysing)
MLRILILDGYTRDGRTVLQDGGASIAGDLYARMIQSSAEVDVACSICFPSDPEVEIPMGDALAAFDAICWTGCSLSLVGESPFVPPQVALAREAFRLGIPMFGSCWAAQIGVVAAGGTVEVNPKGREMGVARKIELTAAGRDHPMFAGKDPVFDAFISHDDHITSLPAGTVCLGGNAWTAVQAVDIAFDKGSFWSVQYHPEYDLHEMARLMHCRTRKLIRLGFFRDESEAQRVIDDYETLHREPGRADLAHRLGVNRDILDAEYRTLEVRNWLRHVTK